MTNRLVIFKYIRCTVYFSLPVIAVRVSGGHLCEAEAPTEPAGETAARRVAIRLSSKGITDSFVLRTQNDTPFSCHECRKVCAVSCCLVIASTVRCSAIRFSFETPTQAEIVIRFVLNLRNKKALIPVKHYGDIKAFKFILSYMCHIA